MILKNCLVYDEKNGKEKLTRFLVNDTIAAVDPSLENFPAAKEIKLSQLTAATIADLNGNSENFILDCEGMIAIPGAIDPHVHFDTPGFTHREDFYHGSMSAAAGGVTTVIDMPCTSLPPVTNGKNFDEKFAAIKDESVVDFGLYGGVCASHFDMYEQWMQELAERKVRGFKTYFVSGMKTFPQVSLEQFEAILVKANQVQLPVLLHAEDAEVVSSMTQKHEHDVDDYLRYCNSRPALAEVRAVELALEAVKRVEGNLHVVHVASNEAAERLNQAAPQTNISYETCPHYLYFTQDDFVSKGTSLKTAPVVKSKTDKELLWKYLAEGNCTFTASDHAPAPLIEKQSGSFWKDYGGIPGVQTLVQVLFSEGYSKKRLSLRRFTEVVSTNAAKRFGLYPRKGTLQVGSDADFAFINPNVSKQFEISQLLSKGETSPFDKEAFTGQVALTILRGKIIYHAQSGITIKKGYGKYLS